MKQKPYDYAVLIGRFQPFHKGHFNLYHYASKVASKVIIIMGSHNKAPDIRNPIDSHMRKSIITKSIGESKNNYYVCMQEDYTYNLDRWVAAIQSQVENIALRDCWRDKPPKVCVVGYDKDHTSYYLKQFPQWDVVEYDQPVDLDATMIRNHMFNNHYSRLEKIKFIEEHMANKEAADTLFNNINHDMFSREYESIAAYKAATQRGDYPVIFQTVDAVVVQAGHILLVKRGKSPGLGQWAFPGGFVGQKETLEEAVLRELKEETKIDVPIPVLKGSLVKQKVFDDPERSVRGRTITSAFYFNLSDNYDLPKVRGSDDAVEAKWITLNKFSGMRNVVFEDHFCIAQNLIGI